jgi:trk system potassium uptake protein TrkA
MKVIIMGCGRVGRELAVQLDREGHKVTALDINPEAFRYLPPDFKGRRVVGNGVDQDVLRKAGVEDADAFVAASPGDNRNVMAAQIARQMFGVPRVVCRIFDPIREDIYRQMGLETVSPTKVTVGLLRDALVGDPAARRSQG